MCIGNPFLPLSPPPTPPENETYFAFLFLGRLSARVNFGIRNNQMKSRVAPPTLPFYIAVDFQLISVQIGIKCVFAVCIPAAVLLSLGATV